VVGGNTCIGLRTWETDADDETRRRRGPRTIRPAAVDGLQQGSKAYKLFACNPDGCSVSVSKPHARHPIRFCYFLFADTYIYIYSAMTIHLYTAFKTQYGLHFRTWNIIIIMVKHEDRCEYTFIIIVIVVVRVVGVLTKEST